MTANVERIDTVQGTHIESQRLFGLSTQQAVAALGLGLIVLLGAFLRFYELGAYSIGNTYYAATVQSMLTSWYNFFFASFEPGGSVTVDKPPLGFWIQAVSAYFLGVNGFALALPQALAGVLSIPLLYTMVKRQFGTGAGLIAALALATIPVTVSTERNNTIDGLLLFVLLLATWAFLRSVRLGRFRYLLLGAFLIGLGFNIKMLQAFLPLPALYVLYLLGAPHSWWKRIVHLAVATVLLVTVSLAWAIAVDLTPPEDRPYIGSSTDNTVMELIVGHNGLKRLDLTDKSGPARDNGTSPPAANTDQAGQFPANPPPRAGQRPGNPPPQFGPGNPPPPPNGVQSGQFPANPLSGASQGPGNPPVSQFGPGNPPSQQPGGPQQEVGQAGLLRLFTEPLVTEASWLLPLVLLGMPLILVGLGWPWPLSYKHLALILWGGWLLPELVYFSFNTGLFHAYYLIMLGPPLAALVGMTAWALWRIYQQRPWLGWTLLALLAGVTVAFQIFTVRHYSPYVWWIAAIAVTLLGFGLGIMTLTAQRTRFWLGKVALAVVFGAMMVAPFTWSALTTLNTHPDVALPRSGPGTGQLPRPNMSDTLSSSQQTILDYLLANTNPGSYLVATLDAREAAPYILETLRPVLTFGGFSGSDNVINVTQLAQMIADGELRFVLGSQRLAQQKPEIAGYLANSCTTVTIPGVAQPGPTGKQPLSPGGPGEPNILYDCGTH
jgi:4-amino-4-deoxy-L-arabinose transferase-like glycosyltransferase